MHVSIRKSKTQTFVQWVIDNLRTERLNPWRQLGVWSVMAFVVMFLVPKLA